MTLQIYMNMHNFHITCIESITPNKTQFDHIWTNVPTRQCHVGTTQAYWTDHNSIYFYLNNLTIFFNLLYQPLTNKC
jgi:hypothetical protein